jgi:hypothetical protein
VVFATRGIRTLPRLPKTDRTPVVHAPDTLMLFDYLKAFNGVCASHTSTTSMGTDWRDWGGAYEPMVEIYQGARQNYERPGAPRSPTANDAIGGWEPSGFINLALKRGYRFSFQSSSDHGSTAHQLRDGAGGKRFAGGLLAAMRARHTYAATDNIIAEFTCTTGGRTYMMGDEFISSSPPTLKVKLDRHRAFQESHAGEGRCRNRARRAQPGDGGVSWTDPTPAAGKTSYYYVRGEQAAGAGETVGELVWVSPMWIGYQPPGR